MLDSDYRPLKSYVARRGGYRLACRARLRDQIVDQIVADWPCGCPVEVIDNVVRAKASVRVKNKYGTGIVATLLLSAFINVIVKLVMEWWFERDSHRVLMRGWATKAQQNAAQNPDVSP
jgi:hypothetical protein